MSRLVDGVDGRRPESRTDGPEQLDPRFTPDGLRHHRQALGTDDIRALRALVQELKDIVAVLANAEPAAKSDVCREFGVTLQYDPSGTI